MSDMHDSDLLIRRIANYRGLLVSNRFLMVLAVILQTVFFFSHYKNATPFIIFFVLVIFPIVAEALIKKNPSDEASLPLPSLRQRYGYTKFKCDAQSLTFLFAVLCIIAWRYSYKSLAPGLEWVRSLPFVIMFAYILVRLLVWGVCYIVLSRNLKKYE